MPCKCAEGWHDTISGAQRCLNAQEEHYEEQERTFDLHEDDAYCINKY